MYFVLKQKEYANAEFGITAISLNPQDVSPVVWRCVKLDTFGNKFGQVGDFKSIKNNSCCNWTTKYEYKDSLNKYEVVRVLDIETVHDKTQQFHLITVYGSKIGEDKIILQPSNILTPYMIKPQIDHRLLIAKKLTPTDATVLSKYDIIHNITLAMKKYETDQHII